MITSTQSSVSYYEITTINAISVSDNSLTLMSALLNSYYGSDSTNDTVLGANTFDMRATVTKVNRNIEIITNQPSGS